ncbi:MAG TPA: glycoside hydrolase family 2 TIM barrel-domain containing protein [Chitinophagaceae bacterium]|nr:glycoside hydrolase family 2 TIM barrel-domain containing protein [Chitinophagaceae bacterium]
MKQMLTSLITLCIFNFAIAQLKKTHVRADILFDNDWRFHRGDIENGEKENIQDTSWRLLQLPHDWSIEDLPNTNSPFSPDALNGVSIGFTTGGAGWYRKTFELSPQKKNKKIFIGFEGIYMNADVWLNGQHLGNHPYGYTSFWYDITDKIKFDSKNIIAVRVRNEGATSRWYSGSGITRHVWLTETEPVHIEQNGTFITASGVTAASAKVNVLTKVLNETGKAETISLLTSLLNAKGARIAEITTKQTIQPGSSFEFNQDIEVKNPERWSGESPGLYTSVATVSDDKELLDRVETKFGIRSISFDVTNGFLLNGNPLKLKGACFHTDNGPLGARSFDRAEERRVALLKASGFNAIRCSHNPPAPAFLDACDRMGMLVIDEAFDMWADGKNDNDYHLYFNEWWQKDMESMVFRDRNHPSIIMWSIGNEIPGMDKPEVAGMAVKLAAYVRKLEPTRPVTAAANSVNENKDPFFAALDISGYNYAKDNYISDHNRKPGRIIFCTESYALQAFDYWMGVVDHPWVIGDFVWTGFDYIGEASIGWLGYPQEKTFYPWNLAYCGDIDICGWKRPQSYYRDALWMKDQLSIFVKPPQPSFPINPKKESWSIWNWNDVVADWNWSGEEGKPLEVNVYSSCNTVELFLNDKSLGKKETNRSTKFIAVWQVAYQKGILKAVGYNGLKQVKTSFLQTAEAPVQIKLSADRVQIKADNQDLSYITVELIDKKGIRSTKAENLVDFTIEGPGTIAGVGNANPVSTESCQASQRKAWQGRCMVVVKSTGKPGNIVLKASAAGLPTATTTIISGK